MVRVDFTKRIEQLNVIIKGAEGIEDRKSTERKAAARAQRKLKAIHATRELLGALPEDAQLSKETTEWVKSLAEEYVPGVKLDIQVGDSLIQLLEEYKDVKDLYKKILKWCDNNNAQIQGTKIVAK